MKLPTSTQLACALAIGLAKEHQSLARKENKTPAEKRHMLELQLAALILADREQHKNKVRH